MADPATKEEREQAPPPAPAPSSSPSPPPQQQQQQQAEEPQEPLLDTFWRWPLLVLLLSYVILLYVRDATTADSTKKEAAGVIPSHQQSPHTANGQVPVVIHPERPTTASQDGKPASSPLSFPVAGGGGGGFHQHPHILVQYCTS